MASIRLDHVWKRYGPIEAVKDLCLTCEEGELLALLGPSGCGKTSTLKMTAGVEAVTAGEIYFGDRPVSRLTPPERNIAMVFEDYALYPHLSVAENIAFPLKVRKRPARDIERAVKQMIELLGLHDVSEETVQNLSGGAQQRVSIGRALVRSPELILFDEPLSHLDGDQKVRLRAEIKRLQKETNFTAVLVTHDQTEAMAMADRVAVMHAGVLQQIDTPRALYRAPANLCVGSFIGEPPMNILTGRLVSRGRDLCFERGEWRYEFESEAAQRLRSAAQEAEVAIGFRPESVGLHPAEAASGNGRLPGRVLFRELRGDVEVLRVRIHEVPQERGTGSAPDIVTAELPAPSGLGESELVTIGLAEGYVHVFDIRTGVNLCTSLAGSHALGRTPEWDVSS